MSVPSLQSSGSPRTAGGLFADTPTDGQWKVWCRGKGTGFCRRPHRWGRVQFRVMRRSQHELQGRFCGAVSGTYAARVAGEDPGMVIGGVCRFYAGNYRGRFRAVKAADSSQRDAFLLREVLEDKQRLGSQTMYICGRIELPTSKRKQGRIWMAWQGDSRLRFWRHETEISEHFRGTMQTNERWSTLTGPVGGQPHVYQTRLEYGMPMRLQLYTDGLDDLDPIREPLPDEQIQVLLEARHTGWAAGRCGIFGA